MRALKPLAAALLASSFLIASAAAWAEGPDGQGLKAATQPSPSPNPLLSEYLARVRKADADCANPALFGCTDVPAPTFGPAPPGGINLRDLTLEEGQEAATAYVVENGHREGTAPIPVELRVFRATGQMPPSPAPRTVSDVKEEQARVSRLLAQWTLFGALVLPFLGLYGFGAFRAFDVKSRFGVWPHNPRIGVVPHCNPTFGGVLAVASFGLYLTGDIVLQMVAVLGSLFSVGQVSDAFMYYRATVQRGLTAMRVNLEVASMMSSTAAGSARLQGSSDLDPRGLI